MLSNQLEQRLNLFESEWDRQASDRIDGFIADLTGTEHLEMLSELIMIDLEMGYRSGEQQLEVHRRLLEYFDRYTELAAHPVFSKKINLHWHDLQQKLQLPTDPAPSEEKLPATIITVKSRGSTGFALPCDFGRYKLLKVIGRGGMGTVFEAEEESTTRHVAIKILHSDFGSNEEAVARFEREVELIGKMDDPRIVPVLEMGVESHHNYYVMPLYQGGTLQARIQAGMLSTRDIARILLDLARTVAAVHDKNVVHRDLKPSNILFGEDDLPRIADFGLSRHIDHSRSLTRTGEIYGTPGYIAPERIITENKQTYEFSADIYSLGAILYALLCGRPPFRGATVWETLTQALSDPPVSPRNLNPQVDAPLNTICLKCLESQPEDRYATCTDLADDLENYLSGRPIQARPPHQIQRLRRFIKRHPAKASLIGAGTSLVVMAFFAIVLFLKLSQEREKVKNQELLQKSETYSSRLATANQLMSDRSLGWQRRTLELLEEAADLEIPGRDPVTLRTMVATAGVHRDIEPVATLAKGMWCDAVAFDPSGQYLALGQNKDVDGFQVLIYRVDDLETEPTRLWVDSTQENALRSKRNHPKPEDGTRVLCFSPDSKRLAIGTRHGRVHVYQWTGKRAEWLETHDPDPGVEVRRLQFSADGNTLWSLSDKKKLRMIHDGKINLFPPIGNTLVHDIAVSPTENAVFLTIQQSGYIQRFDGVEPEPTWQLAKYDAGLLSISNNGNFLSFNLAEDQHMKVVETSRGVVRNTHSSHNLDTPYSYHSFGFRDEWIVSTSHDREVTLSDVAQGRPIASYLVPERGGRPKFTVSPSEPLIAVAEHRKVTVYHVTGTEMFETVSHSPGVVRNISNDALGSRLATLSVNDMRAPERMIDYIVRDLEQGKTVFSHKVIDETRDLADELPLRTSAKSGNLLTISSRSVGSVIPVTTLRVDELFADGYESGRWIPSSEIEFSGASHRPITDTHSRSNVVEELILEDSRRASLLLPKMPDSEFLNEKKHTGRNVFLVCRVESSEPYLEAQVNSQAISSISHQTDIESTSTDYIALWVGLHKLRYPRNPLRIDLYFNRPIERLIVDGVLVRRGVFNEMIEKALGKGHALVTEIVTHELTGRIWMVVDEEHLVIVDSSEWELVGHWQNQSTSHNLGRGTLRPLLSTNKWVITGTNSGEMFVFNAETSELVQSAIPLENRVRSSCAIAKEPLIAVGGSDGVIQVLELPSLEHRQSLNFHQQSIESLCFDTTRGWLFAGSEDGKISVYNRNIDQFDLYFHINLRMGRIQKLLYLPEEDCLAVLIKNESAVRLLHLDRLCRRMKKMGLLEGSDQ